MFLQYNMFTFNTLPNQLCVKFFATFFKTIHLIIKNILYKLNNVYWMLKTERKLIRLSCIFHAFNRFSFQSIFCWIKKLCFRYNHLCLSFTEIRKSR